MVAVWNCLYTSASSVDKMVIELVLSFRVIPAYPLVFSLQDSCWLDLCHSSSPFLSPPVPLPLPVSLFLSESQFTSLTPSPSFASVWMEGLSV